MENYQGARADDLAEHAVPSPNWQAQDLDVGEYFSDWEYYSDAYYDGEDDDDKGRAATESGAGKDKKKHVAGSGSARPIGKGGAKKDTPKRSTTSTPAQASSSIVVYRRNERTPSPPLYTPGSAPTVAILKDWRERYGDDVASVAPHRFHDRARHAPSDEATDSQVEQATESTQSPSSISSRIDSVDSTGGFIHQIGHGPGATAHAVPKEARNTTPTEAETDPATLDKRDKTTPRKRKHSNADPVDEADPELDEPDRKRVLVRRDHRPQEGSGTS